MKFHYQARSKNGEVQTGVVEASNREAAFTVLKSHNLYVTALEEMALPFYARKLKVLERINKKDVAVFSRQLAIMVKSKVPVVETLRTVAEQSKKVSFKDVIMDIAEKVEGGDPLSKAFSYYPKIFTSFYVNMVKSGEASGKLNAVFLYLADYLEKEDKFRSKIRGAMAYPIFVVIVFIVVVTIIMVYVIPQLAEILTEGGAELPAVTRLVIAISDFLEKWWWLTAILFIGIVFGIYKYSKTENGKDLCDRNFLKVPMLNTFLKKLYLSRFAMNLSTLIAGGLPIANALHITGEVVNNNIYKEIIFEVRDGVKRGEKMSLILKRHPKHISPLFSQMIIAGEKTGSVDTSLLNVVEFYERDIEQSLDNFVRLLEPVFIIVLGGVVAGLMAAVLMPLYGGAMMQ